MTTRIYRISISILCAVQLLALTASFVRAQAPLEKLRVAYTVVSPTQLNVWTAKEAGFYARHGLDVELVLLVGAPLAVTAMLAGETPIIHTGASAVITSNLTGSGAVLIAGSVNRFP